MQGLLDMNFARIENVGPGRQGTLDALTHLQFEVYYFDFNDNNCKIEVKNPVDMKDKKLTGLSKPTNNSDAVTKEYVDDKTKNIDLNNYLKRDGSISITGNFDFGDRKITKVGNGSNPEGVVNKGYIDTELASKPNVNQAILRDGSQEMIGTLNMNNFKITNNKDVVTLKQVNDGIATISTQNNQYTDKKIAESHISTHENRKNVLKYAMDDDEFTIDFGIQDASLVTFNDTPHRTNKKAFSMKVQKTTDGSNEYRGRFNFNLFKLIPDNFSDNYTVCMETYFQKSPFYSYEFGSTLLGFEKQNMNIDSGLTIKVNSEYKYLRSILNLSPDGSSLGIQRRLYVNFKSNFDNSSPNLLPIYVLTYGIKGEAKNDLDFTIYDYEKAYKIVNNKLEVHIPIDMNGNELLGLPPDLNKPYDVINDKLTLHIPVDMNGNDILKTSHYLHGYLDTNAQDKTFTINGSKKVLIPSGSTIKQIQILYNSFKLNHKTLNIQIYYGPGLTLSSFFTSSQTTQIQTFNTNMTIQNGHFRFR